MLDTTTYLLTMHNPSGPMLLIEEEPQLDEVTDSTPLSKGEMIGRLIGTVLFLGLGTYLFFAI